MKHNGWNVPQSFIMRHLGGDTFLDSHHTDTQIFERRSIECVKDTCSGLLKFSSPYYFTQDNVRKKTLNFKRKIFRADDTIIILSHHTENRSYF